MNQKQHAPGVRGRRAGALYQVLHKGKEFFLTHNEFSVYSLLMSGGKLALSTLPSSWAFPILVQRFAICVSDVWVQENRMRFKRYFIHGGDAIC